MAKRAATTFYGRFASSGAWTTNTNWKLPGDVTPDAGDYPGWDESNTADKVVNGDIVILDQAVANAIVGGDYSAKGELAGFQVSAAFNKAIGSAITPLTLILGAIEAIVNGSAAGSIWLTNGSFGSPGIIVIDMKPGSTLTLDGTWGICNLRKGAVVFKATTTIETALIVGYMTSMNDVTLTIPVGASVPSLVQASGGNVTCNVSIGNLVLSGGKWQQNTGTLTGLLLSGTGVLDWRSGNITVAYIDGGLLDASQSVTARTMTTCRLAPNGKLDLNNGVDTITVTSLIFDCTNPKIEFTPGRMITI